MPGPVLQLRPHIEHDDVAPRESLLQLSGRDLLDAVPLSQVLVGKDGHLGDVPSRGIAYGCP